MSPSYPRPDESREDYVYKYKYTLDQLTRPTPIPGVPDYNSENEVEFEKTHEPDESVERDESTGRQSSRMLSERLGYDTADEEDDAEFDKIYCSGPVEPCEPIERYQSLSENYGMEEVDSCDIALPSIENDRHDPNSGDHSMSENSTCDSVLPSIEGDDDEDFENGSVWMKPEYARGTSISTTADGEVTPHDSLPSESGRSGDSYSTGNEPNHYNGSVRTGYQTNLDHHNLNANQSRMLDKWLPWFETYNITMSEAGTAAYESAYDDAKASGSSFMEVNGIALTIPKDIIVEVVQECGRFMIDLVKEGQRRDSRARSRSPRRESHSGQQHTPNYPDYSQASNRTHDNRDRPYRVRDYDTRLRSPIREDRRPRSEYTSENSNNSQGSGRHGNNHHDSYQPRNYDTEPRSWVRESRPRQQHTPNYPDYSQGSGRRRRDNRYNPYRFPDNEGFDPCGDRYSRHY